MNNIIRKVLLGIFAILLSSSAFCQVVVATCTYGPSGDGVQVTCKPTTSPTFEDFDNMNHSVSSCPKATQWNLSGNGNILASISNSYTSSATVKLGGPFSVELKGYGGVACTANFSQAPLYVMVSNINERIYSPSNPPAITYCIGQNTQQVAFGYVPQASCSFTPSAAGTYNLYFDTNIGISTKAPFVLTVVP